MRSTNIPAWLRGCRIEQYVNTTGIYSTYVAVGKQLIPFSFSDDKNAWVKHAQYAADSFAQLVHKGVLWSAEGLASVLGRKFFRSMML